MRRRRPNSARRLRATVERLPSRTKEAMLRGIDSNRIIVGAYVDPASGGVCPMLAAHRNGGRTDVASFARAWDEYTGARRARRATRREVAALRAMLEDSLGRAEHYEPDRTPIAELAAQIRAERAARAACRVPLPVPPMPEPRDDEIKILRRAPRKDVLTAIEDELQALTPTPERPPAVRG
jgi:hypothetical protein